ncbi:protein huluwa [Aplochiton taeniatus]
MSQKGQTTPNLIEGLPVTSLTLLILLLIPCVVLLLLLNCLFLGYKLFIKSKKKRKRQEDSEDTLSHSILSTRQRITRLSEAQPFPHQDGRRPYVSLSEPILARPMSSSRTSSKIRAGVDPRIRFIRPDGATGPGSGYLRAPSTILATSSAAGSTVRADVPLKTRMYSKSSKIDWCRSAPSLAQSSDSEVERPNRAPPNSPAANHPLSTVTPGVGSMRRSSTLELQNELNVSVNQLFDKVEFESEYSCRVPPETSCPDLSNIGPGLDSDFGASAGISLRILSADSDGLKNGVWASALEWDYYDPCYVRQNNIPKQKHQRPAIHTKQYWV